MKTSQRPGVPLVGQVGGLRPSKPARDVTIRSGGVFCPACSAKPGAPCLKADGTPMSQGGYHEGRRRMAIRARNVQLGLRPA